MVAEAEGIYSGMARRENIGDAVPTEVVAEIAEAGGSVATGAWWVGINGPSGFYFSNEAVDWIEAVGNGESPEPR